MKTFLFLISIIAAVSLAACGGRDANDQQDALEEVDHDVIPVDGADIKYDGDLPPKDTFDVEIPQQASVYVLQSSETSVNCTNEAIVNIASGIELKGVVVTAPKYVASKDKLDGYYVQDKSGADVFSGMQVVIAMTEATDYKVGDILDLGGEYIEYYCFTQLKALTHSKTGEVRNIQPVVVNPANIASGTGAEEYEGVLVTVENVEVINANPDGPDKDYGNFLVTGNLRVGNDFKVNYMNKDTDQRTVGDKFTVITGVLKYAFGNYTLMPRFNSDMVLETVHVEETAEEVVEQAEVIEDVEVIETVEDSEEVSEVIEDISGEDVEVVKTTIAAIQNLDSSKQCVDEGNFTIQAGVALEDTVVIGPKHVQSGTLDGYYIHDLNVEQSAKTFSGMLLVVPKSLNTNFVVGDILSLAGDYKEFYCMTELSATKADKVNTSDPVPYSSLTALPADIGGGGATAESYEGTLVTVENVEVTNANPDGPANDYGCFVVSGNLYVCNDYKLVYMAKATDANYDPNYKRTVGDKFTKITGVVKYFYSFYRLIPRFETDMVK
ncbi:MAG: hypothetical protein FJ088_02895 [Deltaproteobacteria bacterium]|nr:hypothetical protein [Deltaproteobacteria bacterium]